LDRNDLLLDVDDVSCLVGRRERHREIEAEERQGDTVRGKLSVEKMRKI